MEMEDKLLCPKCKSEIKSENINGLYYKCNDCDFIDDSTLDIMFKFGNFIKVN